MSKKKRTKRCDNCGGEAQKGHICEQAEPMAQEDIDNANAARTAKNKPIKQRYRAKK